MVRMHNKVLIGTFSIWQHGQRTPINGMIEPLLSYFLPKASVVDLIDGLHPGSNNVITFIEQYKNEKLEYKTTSWVSLLMYPLLYLQNTNSTQTLFKIRDFFSTLEWGIRCGKKYDLFIGLESVYTIAGIILKKLGRIKTVVYYVSDYSPNRYPNKWFNTLYLALDRYCAIHADYIWDVSPAMHPARIKAGIDHKKSKPVILVPNALFPEQISPLPLSKLIPYSLVYAGTLTKANGPDIAVEAMHHILRDFPDATLHIFGSNGTDQARIKSLIKRRHLEKNVIFHGFITQVADITNAINKYSIGLAPYLNSIGSHRKFGDATKLRLYMGAGVPVITTDVPPLGKQISLFGAGIITDDNAESLARSVIELFTNKNKSLFLRKKSIELAKNNTWENTYSNAISRMV